jgi:hypothetical protein
MSFGPYATVPSLSCPDQRRNQRNKTSRRAWFKYADGSNTPENQQNDNDEKNQP